MSVNKCIILGRLTTEPELKHLEGGSSVCNFSIATNEKWTDKTGQKQEKVEFHKIVAWSKLAEICHQYLKKGREVYLEGKITTRSWEKDGVKQYMTEIVASNVQFIGGNDKQTTKEYVKTSTAQETAGKLFNQPLEPKVDERFTSSDIPF